MKRQYVEQLTWLRAIAAFFVVLSHSIRAAGDQYDVAGHSADFLPIRALDFGSFGVLLFFVLSGCSLYLSNSQVHTFGGVAGFYTKRFFRIWPAFVVSIAVFIVFGAIFTSLYPVELDHRWVENYFFRPYALQDVLVYLTLAFNFTGPHYIINGVYWTLPIEFQYYLIFPLLILSLSLLRSSGPLIIAALLFAVQWGELLPLEHENRLFDLAFSFCGGVWIAYQYSRTSFRLHPMLSSGLLLLILIGASMVGTNSLPLNHVPFLDSSWHCFGVLAVAAVGVALLTRIPASGHGRLLRGLSYYGEVSYSVYLYHALFVGIAVLLMLMIGLQSLPLKLAFILLLAVPGSFAMAHYSYRFVEKPGISFGRKLAGKLSR